MNLSKVLPLLVLTLGCLSRVDAERWADLTFKIMSANLCSGSDGWGSRPDAYARVGYLYEVGGVTNWCGQTSVITSTTPHWGHWINCGKVAESRLENGDLIIRIETFDQDNGGDDLLGCSPDYSYPFIHKSWYGETAAQWGGSRNGFCSSSHSTVTYDMDVVITTSAPTPYPTPLPTPLPTPSPTPVPTPLPTPPPTTSPTSPPTKAPVAAASTYGDPHFVTFGGEKYDFHGGCDLVLLKNPGFAAGLGLQVHVRTTIKRWWSHISAAAIQVGDNTLEITVINNDCIVLFNREKEGHSLETGEAFLGDYAVKFTRINSHQTRTRIDLGGRAGDAISVETFKEFVRVNVKPKTDKNFAGSVGMLGAYPSGQKVARDEVTIIQDANEFGQEWRVRAGETMLFHDSEVLDHLDTCPMPEDRQKKEGRRRLGEAAITEKDAGLACARVSEFDRDACIFDVLATNDVDMAGSY